MASTPRRRSSVVLPPLRGSKARVDPLRLVAQGDQIIVWLEFPGVRPKRIGAINQLLAADAGRHGQDLVAEMVDEALREAERHETLKCVADRVAMTAD